MIKKERKGLGSTNLSSARGEIDHQHAGASLAATTPNAKPYKGVIQRLLEQSPPQPLKDPKERAVPFRATWNTYYPPSQSSFSTTHRVDYSQEVIMSKSKGFRRTAEETSRRQNFDQDPAREGLRRQALEKLRGLSKSHYGSMTNMMKAFRKQHGDTITPQEFADNLRKIKLDSSLSGIEQDLIFEHFLVEKAAKSANNKSLTSSAQAPSTKVLPTSEVDVTAILARIEEADSNDPKIVERKKEMLNVRNFLAEKVAERRAQREKEGGQGTSTGSGPGGPGSGKEEKQQRLEEAAKTKGIENEDALLKRAIGQRTFDLDLDAEELNEMIEEMYHTRQENDEHDMFVRYLRHTNLKLHDIPFYDLRLKELKGYKLRAAALEAQRNSPRVQGRLKELLDTKKKNMEYERQMELMKTLEKQRERDERVGIVVDGSHPLQPIRTGRIDADASTAYSEREYSEGVDNQTARTFDPMASITSREHPTHSKHVKPAKSPEGKGLFKHKVPGPDNLRPVINNPITSPDQATKSNIDSSDVDGKHPRNLAGALEPSESMKSISARGGGGMDSVPSTTASRLPSNNSLAPLKGSESPERSGLRSSRSMPHVLDFNQSHPSDFYPKLIHAGRTKDMDPSTYLLYRPHYEHEEPKTAGGKKFFPKESTDWSRVGYGTGEPIGFAADAIYSTTNSAYYPEMIYEPSKPVQRDLLSDADKAFMKREERRQARLRRTQENLRETKQRLETEELDREVKQLKRSQRINEDTIRYQTTVFLNDVKNFRLQPLQMMLRKPFLSKSDKMWGGSLRNTDERDERDFSTTYNKSFDSSILRPSASTSSLNLSGWGNPTSHR